jgi:hypothetical protein
MKIAMSAAFNKLREVHKLLLHKGLGWFSMCKMSWSGFLVLNQLEPKSQFQVIDFRLAQNLSGRSGRHFDQQGSVPPPTLRGEELPEAHKQWFQGLQRFRPIRTA